jgi:transcriptional regulator with XRE-family HTH domain
MHIGERIKALRELKGLSQGELSRLSGVSKAYICQIEKKDFNVGLQTLKVLGDALHVSLPLLVDDDLWANKTAAFIVANSALADFLAKNNVSVRDRTLLKEALEENIISSLDPAGWERYYQLLKFFQRRGPSLADFTAKIPQSEKTYSTNRKVAAHNRARQ